MATITSLDILTEQHSELEEIRGELDNALAVIVRVGILDDMASDLTDMIADLDVQIGEKEKEIADAEEAEGDE